jgi:hypothetical protein
LCVSCCHLTDRKGHSSRPRCALPHVCPNRYSRHRGAQKAHTAKTALLKALSPVLSRWNCARSDENSPNSRNPYGKGLNFSSRHFDDLIPAEAIPARAEPLHAIGSRYHLTQLARELCLLIGADARTQVGNTLHISTTPTGALFFCLKSFFAFYHIEPTYTGALPFHVLHRSEPRRSPGQPFAAVPRIPMKKHTGATTGATAARIDAAGPPSPMTNTVPQNDKQKRATMPEKPHATGVLTVFAPFNDGAL